MGITIQLMYFSLLSALSFAQTETFTYKLTQSTQEFTLWTTTPSVRVFKNSPEPQLTDKSIKVYCAKNETEPFVIVIKRVARKRLSAPEDTN